jgi:hypothetical protein
MTRKISAAELVEQVVLEGKGRVISTSDLTFAIREAIPDCEHTDDELAQLIAAIAIQHGCNVSFGEAPPPMDVAKAATGLRRWAALRPAADNDDEPDVAYGPAARVHGARSLAF